MALLIGLAVSPHSWAYDAVMALLMIAYAATHLTEPLRTRLIVAVYALAPLALCSPIVRFDAVAIVVVGGSLAWISWLCGAGLRTS